MSTHQTSPIVSGTMSTHQTSPTVSGTMSTHRGGVSTFATPITITTVSADVSNSSGHYVNTPAHSISATGHQYSVWGYVLWGWSSPSRALIGSRYYRHLPATWTFFPPAARIQFT
ncbi:hypothetical protein ACOMHN_000644 [Nucella lapillus]